MKKNKLKIVLAIFLLSIVFVACKKDKASDFKMVSQGPVGELMVVIEKKQLNSPLGDSIKALLSQNYPGIPEMFGEGYFKVQTMPHRMFKGYARRHRSLLEINIAEKAKNVLVQKDDPFAFNQKYMLVEAKSDTAAMRILGEHSQQILNYFDQGEVEHFARLYNGESSLLSKKIADTFNVWVSAPEYSIKRKEKDFIWASRETKRTSQAIMIYEFPYTSEKELTKEALIAQRDKFLRKYVEGLKEGTYMKTETEQADVTYKVIDVNGYYGVELRGYWTLEGDFMGGPFLMFAIVDEPNDRIVVLDSYIFAPEAKFSKVKFVREIEGIFRTLQMTAK